MLETIETMARLTGARLSAQPNAGRPRDVDGRNLYLCSPDYMASYARRFIAAGVRLVGGCCGTTPDHIRQIALAVRTMTPAAARPAAAVVVAGDAAPAPAPSIAARSRRWRARSPTGSSPSSPKCRRRAASISSAPCAQARRFQRSGRDGRQRPGLSEVGRARERAGARRRSSSSRASVETLLHYSCRDRNADRHAVGSGRRARDRPAQRAAHDRQSGAARRPTPTRRRCSTSTRSASTNMVARLNRGLDIGGQSIGAPDAVSHRRGGQSRSRPTRTPSGAGSTHKVEAGAEFIVTPPMLDLEAFDAVLPRLQADRACRSLAGVAALEGVRHAEFLASEVVGVQRPRRAARPAPARGRSEPPRRSR